ncbi:MAG: D-alanine--D-alanine ligase [Solirubrobacterales bacterium]
MKIAVLMGGMSREREVSLRSGSNVADSLIKLGHQVEKVDVGPDLAIRLNEIKPDLAFLALHGKFGEDGTVQGLLEIMGIPYTASGLTSSAVCMNKILTKKIMTYEGIPNAPFVAVNWRREGVTPEAFAERVMREIGVPVVIKPATEGSTIGTSIVHGADALIEAIREAFEHDSEVLAEKFITGVEVTAGILGNQEPEAFPLIEVVSETGVYDYQSKYTPGQSHHIIPARVSEAVTQLVQGLALKAFLAFGCRGTARVDFIIDEQGQPWALEVNTIPGMTAVSLYPDGAKHHGLAYDDLVARMVALACENWQVDVK